MDRQRLYDLEHGIIRAQWCVDAETGEECLIDLYTNTVVAKRINGKIVDPKEKFA